MPELSNIAVGDIIDSLSDGVYVCDVDRTIVYWSRSAERITGWRAEDVVGRQCFDNVLCHVDKDGHRLCGEEHCPLHRAMITGVATNKPLLVYAQGKSGERVPMQVSTAPLRDSDGNIIGGVETFRDAAGEVHDFERARTIQRLALQRVLPDDDRVRITTHYIPHDIIGGDFFAVEPLDDQRYGLMLADVTGHGIPAALYTMHLSQLWQRSRADLLRPAAFAAGLNNELVKVFQTDGAFATAACGLLDLDRAEFRLAGAGGPPVLLMHADGTHECIECPGFPFAVVADAEYDELTIPLRDGDHVLLFSDGAFEVHDAAGAMLGLDGLIEILRAQGYPQDGIRMDALEEALLRYSNAIRLPDDLTLIEMRFGGG
ncbi:MAG: PP2C family protein-serine/threonine phosphatase [Planctomycetota bacterium]|jgi:PAS domain S-box-containing protein